MKMKLFAFFLSFLALIAAIRVVGEVLPDREVTFDRVVETQLSPEHMARTFSRYGRWPEWHHNLEKVTIQGQTSEAELHAGDTLLWEMQPKGKPWRKYELTMLVEEFDPAHEMKLKLLSDSTGRVPEMFGDLNWTVEYEAIPTGTRVTGKLRAQTRNWRSRLFSRISPRILMNQVFYPDLMTLADIDSAPGVDLSPPKR